MEEQKIFEENNEKKVESLYNGMITNNICQLNFSKSTPISPDFIINEVVFEIETTKVYIAQFNREKAIHQSIWKLFDFLTIALTKQNHYMCKKESLNREVKVSLSEYVSLRSDSLGKSNANKIKKETKEDLEVLLHMSIEGTENQKKNSKYFPKTKICESLKIRNDTIIFVFSEKLAEYLVNSYVMQYPLSLLKTDSRNVNLYPLGRKLALHYSMNNNIKKDTNDKISVRKALSYCPAIPSEEEVWKCDRQIKRRIYEPFEKTLYDLGFDFEFVNDGDENKIIDRHSLHFAEYEKLYIRFSVPGVIIQDAHPICRKEEKVNIKHKKESK